mgnify:CR=1 FL=1
MVFSGLSISQAHILISYPLRNAQTASITLPEKVAPGLNWDFLTPSHEGGLDYGSPHGFLRDRATGGYLAQKWPSSPSPDPKKYFEFSIQPREHCVAQLEGISMAVLSTIKTYGRDTQALSPQRWEVRLSLSNQPEQAWTIFNEPTPATPESAYTVHSFQNAGNFSAAPLIPEKTSATFRIYGFDAAPLIPNEEGLPEIHATGGLIHTTFRDAVLGQDLTLHGSLYCKKETHRYLSAANTGNPLLMAVKLENPIHVLGSGIPTSSLSMIPEPPSIGWAFGLLCTTITAFTKLRNHLTVSKINK